MHVHVELTTAPIPEQFPPAGLDSTGAWVEFRGLVRAEENGKTIAALEYEAYSPMAEREMQRLIQEIGRHRPCLAVRVIHRIGVVPVGEAAIYIGVAGRHRAEAFAMLSDFMDRLKQDVPIWKARALNGRAISPRAPSSHSAAPAPAPATRLKSPHAASEVISLVRGQCGVFETEHVDLAHAAGRVLREPVCAPEDQPPFDRSSVDGYAVRIDDPAPQFRLVDEIRAGEWKPRQLLPGEAVRVATGGALPDTGLQVLMKEDVHAESATVVPRQRSADHNIRFRGEDARAGQEIVPAGTVLQPGTLALLASIGCVRPLVTRLPRVLHVATGNEIVPPDQTPVHGQIRDSNSTLVRTFLQTWGITPMQCRVGEDREEIERALGTQLEGIDLLLISGGASVGEHDFTRALLERAGFTIHVSKTTARPGKPLIFAQHGKTLAFGLPGNPLAHFVCLNLYVRAALEQWSARAPSRSNTDYGRALSPRAPSVEGERAQDQATDQPGREFVPVPEIGSERTSGRLGETALPWDGRALSPRAPSLLAGFTEGILAADLQAGGNSRETFWPARLELVQGQAMLTPLPWSSSGDLTALASANAILRVSAREERFTAGQRIEFLPTRSFA